MPDWTLEESKEMVRLLDAGLNFREVGEILKRSRNAVIGRSHRIGYKKPDPQSQFKEKLKHLYAEAVTCRAKNNGCALVIVEKTEGVHCEIPGCRNTKLKHSRHNLCSVHMAERLALQRRRAA